MKHSNPLDNNKNLSCVNNVLLTKENNIYIATIYYTVPGNLYKNILQKKFKTKKDAKQWIEKNKELLINKYIMDDHKKY